MSEPLDVLVVGAGPTGLTLACDLLRRGVRVRIVDAADRGFAGSRAKGVQPRTLEVFDDLGVLDDVVGRSMRYPVLGLHVGPLTLPWKMISRHRPSEDVPYPETLLVPQYDTDACLRRRVEALGGTVEYSTRLESFCDAGDQVTATVVGPTGREVIVSRFLVGADGGASVVRTNAAIPFVGTTDEADKMIVADVTVDALARNRWHIWPRNGGRFMALCPLPGGQRFQLMLRLNEQETAELTPEAVERLVLDAARHARLSVRDLTWSSVFRPNVRLAECYRLGNVLLAGDAAHVHTPAGAQGLNTGVQDAYNLGWKLGQVLAGGPDELLDSYQDERRPVAARVLGLSSALYQSLTDKPLAAARRGDEERQLKLSYRGGPLVWQQPRGSGVQAGDRAPDARFTDERGRSRTLFDVFRGPHFTLLCIDRLPEEKSGRPVWPTGGAPLEVVRIPAGGALGLRRIYGLSGPAQVLVRPDGYVAHVADRQCDEALARSAALLAPHG